MNKQQYRQCTLRKTISEISHLTQVSYIPAEYAVVGKVLKLRNEDDEWIDGWKVIAAGELNSDPPDNHDSIKRHRNNTGDSLPK